MMALEDTYFSMASKWEGGQVIKRTTNSRTQIQH